MRPGAASAGTPLARLLAAASLLAAAASLAAPAAALLSQARFVQATCIQALAFQVPAIQPFHLAPLPPGAIGLGAALSVLLPAVAGSLLALPLAVVAAAGSWRASPGLRAVIALLCIAAMVLDALHVEAAAFLPARLDPWTLAGLNIPATLRCLATALPLTILLLASRLRRLDPVLLATAAASGASPLRRFGVVVLPCIALPSLAALLLGVALNGGLAMIDLAGRALAR